MLNNSGANCLIPPEPDASHNLKLVGWYVGSGGGQNFNIT